ncbi:dihydroneopterin aldolase [Sphingobacterium sp. UT-1RO-CII-1]|uniref:dihydroneopterin aldolase n=1 Tax=Sphingobacterium sp. UT-1RO-CII-1 TaxID=2995225 RepID=UPI00227BF53D|nr:dihydroneopterin aldolase [Sphingobacterium sp. UT-1RO-CII-1]MCY4779709.1 dihydroneopterin aldolase [Sphingobacterium sp. UT-1RO-CII-1]
MALIIQEVALRDVRFFAPIGYYPEEQILGNEFFVDVALRFPFDNKNLDAEDLQNTVNYEELYKILVEIMTPKRKLLESAAKDILNIVELKYPFVNEAEVIIRKTTPPFGLDYIKSVVSLSFKK